MIGDSNKISKTVLKKKLCDVLQRIVIFAWIHEDSKYLSYGAR
jgi:hypothetical protein